MGYSRDDGQWIATEDITLLASAARTASANGAGVETGDKGTIRATLDVTVVGADADETLDVDIETSEDNATWRTLGSFTQVTQPGGAGSERLSFGGADRFVRAVATLAGTTPEFTFSVLGEAA